MSSSRNETMVKNQAAPGSGADLRGQYRPIGIGAVAAALSAAGKPANDSAPGAANSNERTAGRESLAA